MIVVKNLLFMEIDGHWYMEGMRGLIRLIRKPDALLKSYKHRIASEYDTVSLLSLERGY